MFKIITFVLFLFVALIAGKYFLVDELYTSTLIMSLQI